LFTRAKRVKGPQYSQKKKRGDGEERTTSREKSQASRGSIPNSTSGHVKGDQPGTSPARGKKKEETAKKNKGPNRKKNWKGVCEYR